jgi:signal transduction histidine kinase
MAIWTLWVPDYGWEALVKVLTAVASVTTAIMLWPLLPRVLAMPSAEQLRQANDALRRRAEERDRALLALQHETEERRRVEAMLWQAQKAEAIGQLAGGIAHDFNNLLTAIQISLDRALRLSADGEPKLQKALQLANSATEKAGLLTNRMLVFARKQPLQPAELDLNELLLELSPLLRNILGEARSLQVKVDTDAEKIFADRNQLEQALLNLAVNARDAMPDAGSLTISTRRRSSAEGRPSGVVIRVEDTGLGMTKDVLARAFEPFFTTKPVGQGSGLGLSQVFGFVEQSNGKVNIESEPGLGTSVSIELPAQ